jgi:dihydrofolate reductase
MPKYVLSATLKHPEWNNATVISGNLTDEVARLKQAHDRETVVHGSAQLVQVPLDQDLVDELRLMVYPVVLGRGKRLFGPTSEKKPMRLVDSKTVGDGVAILTYRSAA